MSLTHTFFTRVSFSPFFLSLFKIFITQSFQVFHSSEGEIQGVTDFTIFFAAQMEEQGEGTYLRKIFPRAGHQKTTRHLNCVHSVKNRFWGPSTSKGGEPVGVEDEE